MRIRSVHVHVAAALTVLSGVGAIAWFAGDARGEGAPVAAPSTTVAGGHDHDHHDHGVGATPAQQTAATKLYEATKAATARYRDIDAALAAGYRPNPRGGANATHYPNRRLMRDGKVLDPNAPESLMYLTAPDGRKVLVAAVFKTTARETAPAPGGPLTAWHTHAGGRMCHPALDATCPQDTAKMMHVFVFDGVQDPFADNAVQAAGSRAALRHAIS